MAPLPPPLLSMQVRKVKNENQGTRLEHHMHMELNENIFFADN